MRKDVLFLKETVQNICLLRAVKALMALSHRAWQDPVLTFLRKRSPCKLLSQFHLIQTPSLSFHLRNVDTHTHTHTHTHAHTHTHIHTHTYKQTHQHLLATCHVGVRLRDSGEGQQTGAVSTFCQGDTVTYTHRFLPPFCLRVALLSLNHSLSSSNKIFTRVLTITSSRVPLWSVYGPSMFTFVSIPLNMWSSMDRCNNLFNQEIDIQLSHF